MKVYESDLLIVGGGASGLTAANTAAELGASVILLEKMSTTGGCANMSAGPFAVESVLQKKHMMSLTREQAIQKYMTYCHWRADEQLVRKFINKTGDTISWLMGMGVKFMEPMAYFPGAEPTWHFILSKEGKIGWRTGAGMVSILTERAKELGVDIFLDSPVLHLLKEDGKIVGALAEDEDGEQFEVHAPATLICTGGYGANDEMIKEYTGWEVGKNIFPYQIPGLDGDGIKMAWEAGAEHTTNMAMEMIYFTQETGGYAKEEVPFRQCGLVVNTDGERFMDETQMGNPIFTVNAMRRQRDQMFWSIIDEDYLKTFAEKGPDYFMINSIVMEFSKIYEYLGEWLEKRPDIIVRADTVEELAEKMGVSSERLSATVETYNGYCGTRDELFNKDHKYMRPIRMPKLYAMKFRLCAYGSLGGIRINHEFKALGKNLEPIAGLFAAGTDSNDICNPDYAFILPGNTLSYALNSGRLAAESAVGYVQALYDAAE